MNKSIRRTSQRFAFGSRRKPFRPSSYQHPSIKYLKRRSQSYSKLLLSTTSEPTKSMERVSQRRSSLTTQNNTKIKSKYCTLICPSLPLTVWSKYTKKLTTISSENCKQPTYNRQDSKSPTVKSLKCYTKYTGLSLTHSHGQAPKSTTAVRKRQPKQTNECNCFKVRRKPIPSV